MFRTALIGVLASVGLATLAPAAAAPTPAAPPGPEPFPDWIELPDGFLPEGIAIGSGPRAWFGSRADGDIYQASLVTGEGRVISQGPGTPSVGMKVDQRGRLFVAGGQAGDGRVVSTRTGEILASYQFTTEPSFVNDVLLTRHAAWFTDSSRAELYRLPLGRNGALPADAESVPLTGEWQQTPGFNANGIAQTPDRSALLVVQSSTGLLFRVDPATGEATQVDLGGTLLTNGDGLLVVGRTLYAVQNQDNQVAEIRLNRAGTAGTLVTTHTSPDFDTPTTVAAFGPWLYLPNARFNTAPAPDTPYWVTRIRP
ncbi:MAG TPA: superoxide dismutase [Nocardioidaceae bacterium]|nr:superoxide dismutase [Nocardioidaceae bacterium]